MLQQAKFIYMLTVKNCLPASYKALESRQRFVVVATGIEEAINIVGSDPRANSWWWLPDNIEVKSLGIAAATIDNGVVIYCNVTKDGRQEEVT